MPERSLAWRNFVDLLRARMRSAWAELDRALLDATACTTAPSAAGWSALEIGEHVVLVDHFLLLLAEKIARKALARSRRGEPIPGLLSRCDHLTRLAVRDFRWASPEHMLPTYQWTLSEVRTRLAQDRERCQGLLDDLPAGEGALHRIRMSVVGTHDRLDLYQFVCVIALHAERHAAQIRRGRG